MTVDVSPFSLDEPISFQGLDLLQNNRKPWPELHKTLADYHIV